MGEIMLTTKEAAMRLGLSPSTLNKARVGGTGPQIPHVLLGGSVRYKASDLDAFIEAHRVQPERPVE